jgi:dTDP-glucose pyrophosphorylase
MKNIQQHLISRNSLIKEALAQLNKLAADAILFVTDDENRLLGSLTDGDVRRGFLRGLTFTNPVLDFIEPNPKYIVKGKFFLETIIDFRNRNLKVIPVVDDSNKVVDIVNFRLQKSYLPLDAVIMAGGRGERLRPFTDSVPKPLLCVGEKPIIEHNLDRLISFGINSFWFSLRYKGEQIEEYLAAKKTDGVTFQFIFETDPLGTIGAVSNITNFSHDYLLISNSDILTNLDYESFFLSFLKSGADLSVVTIPYEVSVPYAVLETMNGHVLGFKEKPTYTYYSNGGIYLMKRAVADLIPKNQVFNATDLMESLINNKGKVHSYPLHGYWLDIGKIDDFNKAQVDIVNVKF